MRLTSSLVFPHLTFKHWSDDDREVAVLIVKGTFAINADGSLAVIEDQPPIVEVGAFWGEENASSLKVEQEIAPSKPRTDVTLNAVARTPEGEELREWPVSVTIEGRAFYEFQVRGPSWWRKKRLRWRLSDPEPVTEVPIRYELAYGGCAPTSETPEYYEYNPVGQGYVNDHLLKKNEPIAAPQIGDIAEFMAGNVKAKMTVHGLGPISKAWLPRRTEAGTFDIAWQNTRHPRMPKDYSFAFWNAAPKRLQIEPFLSGGERFSFTGLRHDPVPYELTLPTISIFAHQDTFDGPKTQLDLTDVAIDVADADQTKHRVTLIWRAMFDDPDEVENIHIASSTKEESNDEQISDT